MKLMIALGLALGVIGCSGSSSPTAPTLVSVGSPPAVTLSGTVSATNGGQPLSGLTISINGAAPTTTTAAGGFTFAAPPLSRVTVTGPNVLERVTRLSATSALDAIHLDGTFDLAFYRQFARNMLASASGTPEPLRRWMRNPNVYLRTVDEAGAPMNPATLAIVEAVFRDATPTWTGGKLAIGTVERGTDTRIGQAGWITVRWAGSGLGVCGRSQIALEGGAIDFNYETASCRPCGEPLMRTIVRHELGHALGFRHTDQSTDLMSDQTAALACDKPVSARERYHGAIVYARPHGNLDPDIDP